MVWLCYVPKSCAFLQILCVFFKSLVWWSLLRAWLPLDPDVPGCFRVLIDTTGRLWNSSSVKVELASCSKMATEPPKPLQQTWPWKIYCVEVSILRTKNINNFPWHGWWCWNTSSSLPNNALEPSFDISERARNCNFAFKCLAFLALAARNQNWGTQKWLWYEGFPWFVEWTIQNKDMDDTWGTPMT